MKQLPAPILSNIYSGSSWRNLAVARPTHAEYSKETRFGVKSTPVGCDVDGDVIAVGRSSNCEDKAITDFCGSMGKARSLVRGARGATWLSVQRDTVLYRKPSKWHREGVLLAGALVVPTGPPVLWHGYIMVPLRGGGCVDAQSLQEFVAERGPCREQGATAESNHWPARKSKLGPTSWSTSKHRPCNMASTAIVAMAAVLTAYSCVEAELANPVTEPTAVEEGTGEGETAACGTTVFESQEATFVPNRFGQPVASPCLIPGGCQEHRVWWSFQHRQSGGRRTFQPLHDPSWQASNAGAREGDQKHVCGKYAASRAPQVEIACGATGNFGREGPSPCATLRLLTMGRIVEVLQKVSQGILLTVLAHGCASGDTAAGGASALWMLGMHANTTASCSAFTMLVMLSLDASVCSFELKTALCAISAASPLFPPKRHRILKKSKVHMPMIVEASSPQQLEDEHVGQEIVCDDPPSSRLPATKQDISMHACTFSEPRALKANVDGGGVVCDEAALSSPPATGHAKALTVRSSLGQGALCCETASFPGLNIQWPFSQLILSGDKTVEVRSYALGWKNIARPGVEMWLVETPGEAGALPKGWVLPGSSAVAPRPKIAQIVGTVTFSASEEGSGERYENPADFRADVLNHRIGQGGKFDWQGKGERYGWRISAVRRLAQPVLQPGLKGTTGFVLPRCHTVRFLDTTVLTPSDATPTNAQATSSGSTKRDIQATTVGGLKKAKISETVLREGLFFDRQHRAWCGMHALNNYMLGPFVKQDDCRRAAQQIVERLSDIRAGDEEPLASHLDPNTGWLSVDVINVLGQANLGIHVESTRVPWPDLRNQQDVAALVNWNQRHWTVLQRDPSGDGWMHTNSIEGAKNRMGARGGCLMMESSTYSLTSPVRRGILRCTSSLLRRLPGIAT